MAQLFRERAVRDVVRDQGHGLVGFKFIFIYCNPRVRKSAVFEQHKLLVFRQSGVSVCVCFVLLQLRQHAAVIATSIGIRAFKAWDRRHAIE